MVTLLALYQHAYAKLTTCSATGELKLRETAFSIHVPNYWNRLSTVITSHASGTGNLARIPKHYPEDTSGLYCKFVVDVLYIVFNVDARGCCVSHTEVYHRQYSVFR